MAAAKTDDPTAEKRRLLFIGRQPSIIRRAAGSTRVSPDGWGRDGNLLHGVRPAEKPD
jgi:hypothetical protein